LVECDVTPQRDLPIKFFLIFNRLEPMVSMGILLSYLRKWNWK